MYYHYNHNMTGFEAVSPVFRHPCLFDERDIPLENAKLLDGELYDARELECCKKLKQIELDNYLARIESYGYMTSLKLKSDSGISSVEKLNLGLRLYELNSEMKSDSKVIFCDYDNQLHEITLADYKQICKEVGNYYSNGYSKKWIVRQQLNNAKTIDEVKQIII